MSGHTPGPWKIAGMGSCGIWIVAQSPDPERAFIHPDWVAELHEPEKSRIDGTTIDANARLIAAAPETARQRDALLEALKGARDALHFIEVAEGPDLSKEIAPISAAIAACEKGKS